VVAITETMGDCAEGTTARVNLRIEGEFPLIQETLELTIATSKGSMGQFTKLLFKPKVCSISCKRICLTIPIGRQVTTKKGGTHTCNCAHNGLTFSRSLIIHSISQSYYATQLHRDRTAPPLSPMPLILRGSPSTATSILVLTSRTSLLHA
jgi:hypothetical protein